MAAGEDFSGWFPARLTWSEAGGEAELDWVQFNGPRFEEAFLEETIQACMQRPFNLLFRRRTGLEALERWAEASPGIAPTGFVFHVSRCGSTLLAHLLRQIPDALVLSEPGPVDALIRANAAAPRIGRARRVYLLRAMVSALGQRRSSGQGRLFIKFDAWNLLHLDLIREAFPETPWVLLYRDPLEVLVSAVAQRGVHTQPHMMPPGLFGLEAEAGQAPAEQYCARVLAALYRAGLEGHDPARSILLNYAELPEAASARVLPHFGVEPDPETLSHLRGTAGFNPKQGTIFVPDVDRKQFGASEAARAADTQWMRRLYDELEERRQSAAASVSQNTGA